MLPDRVSNPGPLTYESGGLPIALRGPALYIEKFVHKTSIYFSDQTHGLSLWIPFQNAASSVTTLYKGELMSRDTFRRVGLCRALD